MRNGFRWNFDKILEITGRKEKKVGSQEAKQQSYFFDWLYFLHPDLRYNCFAIPNGGSRSRKDVTLKNGNKVSFSLEGKRLKQQGVTAGVPDVLCCFSRGHYHGLFIEFKFGKNKLSAVQKKMFERFEKEKYKCVVCYGWEEASREFEDYINLKGEKNGK